MINYRDRTFCQHYKDCIYGGECDMAMTPAVLADAERIELPVAVYTEKPSCHATEFDEIMNENPALVDALDKYKGEPK